MAGPKPKKQEGPKTEEKKIGDHIMTGGLRPSFTTWWRPPSATAFGDRHHVVIHYVVTYCFFGVGPAMFFGFGPYCFFGFGRAMFFRLLAPVVFSTSCFIGFPVTEWVEIDIESHN